MTKITKKTAAKKTAAAKAVGPKSTVSAKDIAIIESAEKFNVTILIGRGQFKSAERPTLATARAWAPVLEKEANNGRLAMVYALDPNSDRAVLVPASYKPAVQPMGKQPAILPAIKIGKPSKVAPAVDLEAAKAEAAELAAVKAKAAAKSGKPEKPAKKAAAKKADAKPAKKAAAITPRAPKAGSKAETVVKMLTRKGGASRKDIVAAVDGWNVDLKQLCARKGLKLTKSAEGIFSAK